MFFGNFSIRTANFRFSIIFLEWEADFRQNEKKINQKAQGKKVSGGGIRTHPRIKKLITTKRTQKQDNSEKTIEHRAYRLAVLQGFFRLYYTADGFPDTLKVNFKMQTEILKIDQSVRKLYRKIPLPLSIKTHA